VFAKRRNPHKCGLFFVKKQNNSSLIYGKIELSKNQNHHIIRKELHIYDTT